MDINKFLEVTRHGTITQDVRPAVYCADGFNVSIQAGEPWYCSPRIDDASEYTHVELGFPSEEDELIESYAEDPENLCDTVYGWVPVETVNELISKHGGFMKFDDWRAKFMEHTSKRIEMMTQLKNYLDKEGR